MMRLEAEFFICGSTYILLSEHGVETNRGFLGNSLSWNLGFYFSPSTSNILICGLPNNTDSDHESPIPDHMGYEILFSFILQSCPEKYRLGNNIQSYRLRN